MEFPVDVLEATSHGELERSARSYMNELLYTDPDHAHYFTLPTGKKVQISLSSVGFVPLYGANLQHKVLALFTPQDQLTAVALFLANQWYSVEDILKTANFRREGLVKVRSVGERIVLYVLNRIVYRTNEMGSGEMPFLCHSENDYAKILWKNGQAVGFYSVKPKGSVCNNSLRQCYFLPVMDSIFVRKAHRGKGYGLQMLEDFVDSFNEDELGLKYPLTPAMTNVCRHYLDRYPADVDLFWEVEGVGGPYQRTRVAYKLSSRPLNVDTHKGGHGEDNGQNGDIVEEEVEESEGTCLNITEEVIVVNKHHKVTEEIDTPISTRTRSSEHRRRKRVRDEEEAKGVDSRPDKINRMEMAEEEKKEFVPADGVVVESVPEAPSETPVPTVEVNGKQAENKDEVKEGAEEEDESAIQNGTGGEEEEEMEVEEEAEEHKAPVQKTVDTSEEPAAEQPEAAPVAEDNQEMEVDPIAHVQQKEDDAPAAGEERVAENEQKQEDTQVAPAAEEKQEVFPAAHEEQEVAPAVHEEQDVAPAAEKKQEVAPAAEKKQVAPAAEEEQEVASAAIEKWEVALAAEEKLEVAPDPEEKLEVAPANEEEEVVAPVSEEEQEGASATEEEQVGAPVAEEEKVVDLADEEEKEGAPTAKEKQDEAAVAVEEQERAPSVEEEQEVAPEIEKNEVDPAAEEEQEVDPPTEETSSLATDAEGEQGQEEAMDVVNDIDEVTDISEQSSKEEERQPSEEKENNTLMVEEEEAAQKEDEMDEEGEEKNLNETSDFSRVLRGARTKAVPRNSKRTSKRLSKMTLEDEEEEQGEAKVVEEDRGMSTEEEKVTTEEEAEHSSEEEEQVHDPPVIDKRVLRGKTKVIKTTQRTRSKRRGKM
ncbi:soluble lamin-associated protein of 75 kDa isoform X2 [Pangasianodon hypophthalmus]|uniref:soluble lamin-associated protein of 75 kDa isoform X2 n=1 Tax=Pangasianodon hypophthalmus TaxID=310915 RepID=UPI0023080E8A|nr:soluble lamin-associated protein of 75 kDa isoform X2 [Pangasianodon hypophthalmus]